MQSIKALHIVSVGSFSDLFDSLVTPPSTLTSIGTYAFYGCTGLTSTLTIPSSVTSIEESTFSNCTGLTGVSIPGSVKSIGQYAFHGSTKLTTVVFGAGSNSTTEWSNKSFSYGYNNLTGTKLWTAYIAVPKAGTYALSTTGGITWGQTE